MAIPKGTTRYTPQIVGENAIEEALGGAFDAVGAVRKSRNLRYLASGEIMIARSVFKATIPYSRILISDGLGLQGREYTLPITYTSPRKYIVHVGERGYIGMSLLQNDKDTLIHELTHVWQGQHTRWAWTYVLRSLWHQAGGNAYDYDKTNYKQWKNYNPEQQAQIVEDWYHDGANEDESDQRYRFIVENIRGEIPHKVGKFAGWEGWLAPAGS